MLNRSIICKVANNLRKGGYTLSQAFRMAWKLAKGKASVKGCRRYQRTQTRSNRTFEQIQPRNGQLYSEQGKR